MLTGVRQKLLKDLLQSLNWERRRPMDELIEETSGDDDGACWLRTCWHLNDLWRHARDAVLPTLCRYSRVKALSLIFPVSSYQVFKIEGRPIKPVYHLQHQLVTLLLRVVILCVPCSNSNQLVRDAFRLPMSLMRTRRLWLQFYYGWIWNNIIREKWMSTNQSKYRTKAVGLDYIRLI